MAFQLQVHVPLRFRDKIYYRNKESFEHQNNLIHIINCNTTQLSMDNTAGVYLGYVHDGLKIKNFATVMDRRRLRTRGLQYP